MGIFRFIWSRVPCRAKLLIGICCLACSARFVVCGGFWRLGYPARESHLGLKDYADVSSTVASSTELVRMAAGLLYFQMDFSS